MNDYNLEDIQGVIADPTSYLPTEDGFLDERYHWQIITFGSENRYYRLFYRLARKLAPGLVVELGGWQGTGAAHFAGGGARMVISIDHHTDPGDDAHREKMIRAAHRYPNMLYHQGWTWDVLPEIRALGRPIDILFIDSWHQYEYAKRDWDDYSPLLADGALVIADDILSRDGPVIAGMRRFWDEISAGREAFLDEGVLHPGIPMGFLKWAT